ncbi:MAG: hypothetical protein H0T89_16170 [Deltaproteobacteria bacterium]|nr:hypothetical protein [Deltaproteobacteria bacterium]
MERLLAAALVMLAVAACGPAAPDAAGGPGGPDAGGGGGGGGGGGDDPTGVDTDSDAVDDASDNCPAQPNEKQEDGDADGYGDECDCDPVDQAVAAELVLVDALATNTDKFKAATGFSTANWSYASGALRQTGLVNNGTDATFLESAVPMRDVLIEVTAASTEIAEFDTTDLRQIFLVARASSSTDQLGAIACGIEVVEGLTPTQKTTAATVGGTPAAVTVTPAQRTNRAAVQVNEEFRLRMVLKGQVVTCSAVVAGVETVATATNLSSSSGEVGFLTRETKALFKNVRICSYR